MLREKIKLSGSSTDEVQRPDVESYDFRICKNCCGEAQPLYRVSWKSGDHSIYNCSRCSLHYLDYLDRDQPEDFVGFRMTTRQKAFTRDELQGNSARFTLQVHRVQEALELQGCSFLDIGAGGGLFLKLLRDQGALVSGVELNPARIEFARSNYSIRLEPTEISHDSWQVERSGSFDGVSLWDVLEHVNFPRAFLLDTVNLIAPGGYLFLDTPIRDSPAYRAGELAYRLSGGRQPFTLRAMYSPTRFAHKQILTLPQIVELLRDCGLHIVAAQRFSELSFPCEHYLRQLLPSACTRLGVPRFGQAILRRLPLNNKAYVVARRERIP